jgi:thiosulfate dehydrogenase [quinone] large subunit
LSVDAFLSATIRSRAEPSSSATGPDRQEIDRRAFALKAVAVGTAGAPGMALAGLAAGVGRLVGHASDQAGSGAVGTGPGATTVTTAKPGPTKTTPPGKKVFAATTVAVGGSATFNDPKTGDPAVVVQPSAGSFAAFDAICPHEGCTVAYTAADKLFICPCHGSEFNGETGALVKGPANRGLTPIAIAEGPDGDLYAT